jgi:undecaprenyl-diphosphatase
LNPWHAVLLAVVQGITEFIPVSSSAHLILVPFFLGWKDQGLDFDIATNTGTLIAVLVYFRRDVRDLVVGFFTGQPRSTQAGGDGDGHPDYDPRRLAWAIMLGTIPAGIAGLLIHDWVKTQARNPLLIAGTSIGYGLLLLLADRLGRKERTLGDLGISAALLIGVAQALALIPGTSRSGITITAALLLGFSRPAAARFSFLLSIPIGVLVALKSAKDLLDAHVTAADLAPMAIGVVVSAVVGYLVIAWLLAWLRRQSLTVFVVYRLLLGALILAMYFRM